MLTFYKAKDVMPAELLKNLHIHIDSSVAVQTGSDYKVFFAHD